MADRRRPLGGVRAYQFDLPVSLSYGDDGFNIDVGELTVDPIPARDIETGLQEFKPTSHCLSFDEVIQELCKRGIIPPELCPTPEDKDQPTPSILPGPIPFGPGPVGPGPNCVANNNLSEIADSFISRCCKASIRREFPGELL